jgi:hypothetical protein
MTRTATGLSALGVLLAGLVSVRAAAAVPLACAPAGASCERAPVGFEPAYPAGGGYDDFVGPAHGSDIMDDDADGSFNDERCGTNREAELAEIGAVLGVLVALGSACEALPAGPNIVCATPPIVPAPGPQEFCSAALAVPAALLEVNAIFITRCEIQGALVDRAEVEAAYENTKLLLSRDLELHLRECNQLVGLVLPRRVGGRLEEVRAFVDLRIAAFEEADALNPADVSRGVERAKWWLARGDGRLADSRFKDAFLSYCSAYRELRNLQL